MQMLLAIDTSTRNASVALHDGAQAVAGRSWRSAASHSAELMTAVDQVLKSRQVAPGGLTAVAASLGPGGFSALRTGLSVAKGLAMTARIPIIGISSLELEAHPFRDAGLTVCALLEAGRGEVSSALLAPGGARLREDRITSPGALLEEMRERGGEATLFCGEGLAPWAADIRNELGERAVICLTSPSARAESLAMLAQQRLSDGEADDLDSLQPNYLRMPSIGAPKRRDRKRQPSSRDSAAPRRA